ncbi:MAG: methyltransferase domain-containing protein [Sedimentisphaerales bacterium]|nr:methyltransferase domain-containing protein [Sedimentisphaerales bacterium]
MPEHLCPVWVGYFLASRLRRFLQNPRRILGPYVRAGMTVLDIGPAMGFFSLPMAERVGPGGKVVCVDVQPRMLDVLRRRAARAGLAARIQTHVASEDSLGLEGYADKFDFALAFAVLHEVPDQTHLLGEVHRLVKLGAPLLLAEPTGHVTGPEFEQTIARAREAGFAESGRPQIRHSRAAVLIKPQGRTPERPRRVDDEAVSQELDEAT